MPHKDAAGGDAEVRSPGAPEDAAPPLREPLAHRDPGQFAQVQRSVVVSLRAILGVTCRVTYGVTHGVTRSVSRGDTRGDTRGVSRGVNRRVNRRVTRRVTRRDTRGNTQTADIELKGQAERRPVSCSHLPMFKEM